MQPEELAEHIRRLVDQAPPLDSETKARLAGILRPRREVQRA